MYKNNSNITSFPDELVPDSLKESYDYGLKWAKAIYTSNRYGNNKNSLFNNDDDIFRVYMDYALGNQSEDKYKPVLGINPNNITDSMLPSIRWGIRNYATKKINIVVSKVTSKKYDPVCNAIDPLALDIKNDFKFRLQNYIRDREWIDSMSDKMGVPLTPNGLTMEDIPTHQEDVEIMMQSNMKLTSEIEIEKGISIHLERNNYEELRKQLIFDIFVLGVGCSWVGIDEYGDPDVRRIPPEDMIVPYSELPNFSNINYAGNIERLTMTELRRLAGDEFSEDEYRQIESFAVATDRDNKRHYNQSHYTHTNEVPKVRVLRFEYITDNEIVHVIEKDKFGNDRFIRKPYNYYASKREQEKFKEKYKGKRNIVRTPYTAVYQGYWIIDSDFIFNYCRKSNVNSHKDTFGASLLGYKIYAPNMYSGQVVSTVKQMIPLLDDLQTYHLKLQQVVAAAVPKGIDIDLYQLSQAKFIGRGKKELTDLQKIEMYMQRGIILRNSGGRTLPGTTNRPIMELENGMAGDVVRYIELIRNSLENLDDIIGVNRVMSAGNLHQDTGKGTSEIQLMASETAIDYIYSSDNYIFNEVCKSLCSLHLISVKLNGGKSKYVSMMGDNSVRFILEDKGLLKHDYGMRIEPRPDVNAWQRFYQRVDTALQGGQIGLDDAAKIERLENLKEAELYLRVAIQRLRRQQQENEERKIRLNSEQQQQSNEIAAQKAIEIEKMKQQTIILQAEEERKTLVLKYKLEREVNLDTQSVKGDYKIAETDKINRTKENIKVLESFNKSKQ